MSCSSGRLRSTAARIDVGVAAVSPIGVGLAERRDRSAAPSTPRRVRRHSRQPSRRRCRRVRRRRRSSCAGTSPTARRALRAGAVRQQHAKRLGRRPPAPPHAAATDRPRATATDRRRTRAAAVPPAPRRRAAGDQKRRSAIVGARVGVRAGVEQQPHRFDVGRRPHQRGRAGAVGGVGIGARVEQPLHERGVAVQGGRHQRRRAAVRREPWRPRIRRAAARRCRRDRRCGSRASGGPRRDRRAAAASRRTRHPASRAPSSIHWRMIAI